MPLPKPKKNENKDDFISRCMGDDVMLKEYEDDDQRYAVCISLWDDRAAKIIKEARSIMKEHEIRIEPATKDSPARLSGYPAIFNKLSEEIMGFRERIAPGAFSKSLARPDDIRALVDHDPAMIIGRNKAGTLKLEENTKGLKAIIKLPDTSIGRDIAVSVERGDVTGMSFGFQTITDEWNIEDGQDIRTLKEVKLFDVSVVTYPAYPDTTVAVRSMNEWLKSREKARDIQREMENRLRLAEIS